MENQFKGKSCNSELNNMCNGDSMLQKEGAVGYHNDDKSNSKSPAFKLLLN